MHHHKSTSAALRRRIARTVIAAAAATGLLAGCSALGGGTTQDVVIAYNSPNAWANFQAVREAFAADSGITVPEDTKNSGQALAAIVAEESNPQADIGYWGVTFGIDAKEQGLLEPYTSDLAADIDPSLVDPDGAWTSVHYGSVAFLVNTDALGDTPVPRTWDDLLKPEYEGQVFYANPSAAAIGYFTAAAVNAAYGGDADDWEPALEYFEKLKANGASAPDNTTPSKIASGEYAILIDADFNGYIQKYTNDAPVETVIPEQSTVRVPYSVGVVADGPNPDGAKKWIDFLLSDAGQQKFAEAYIHPVRGEIPADVEEKMVPRAEYDAATKDVDYVALAAAHDAFIDEYRQRVG